MRGTRSTLLVPVPAAEAAVAPWRQRFDPAAAAGIPAHITVLFPFVPPELVSEQLSLTLRELFAACRTFDFALERIDAFPGVLFLAPEPAERFIELTRAVHGRWPDHPPYEGAFDGIVPHLTVGTDMRPEDEQQAVAALTAALPISERAREVELFIEYEGRWSPVDAFPVGS